MWYFLFFIGTFTNIIAKFCMTEYFSGKDILQNMRIP